MISFVVQGKPNKLSENLSHSIRKHFPDCEIIQSTTDSDSSACGPCDQFIQTKDPGDSAGTNNVNLNRQIVNTISGIRVARHNLVVKIRNDLLFHNNHLLHYWKLSQTIQRNAQYEFFQNMVLSTNYYTANPIGPFKLAHHPSDWLVMGYKDDLIPLYDIPLCHLEKSDPLKYRAEQYIWISALRKKYKNIEISHDTDHNPSVVSQGINYLCHNWYPVNLYRLGLSNQKHTGITLVDNQLVDEFIWQEFYNASQILNK